MYVLVATTTGDELRGPERTVVMTSKSREKLEALRTVRAKERAEFFAANPLPEYRGSLISDEAVEEVLEI